MNPLSSFILPAALGLVVGVGHGFISHYADLPASLSEQFLSAIQIDVSPSSSNGWDEE